MKGFKREKTLVIWYVKRVWSSICLSWHIWTWTQITLRHRFVSNTKRCGTGGVEDEYWWNGDNLMLVVILVGSDGYMVTDSVVRRTLIPGEVARSLGWRRGGGPSYNSPPFFFWYPESGCDSFFFNSFFFFYYYYLAALGLCCLARAFSSCRE